MEGFSPSAQPRLSIRKFLNSVWPLTASPTRAFLAADFSDLGQTEMFFDSPTDFGAGFNTGWCREFT
jgi:hypothetical protein